MAEACNEIVKNAADAARYTPRANLVAVVSNGDAAWQAPCEEEQRGQGQKGACSVHLNLKRFGYISDTKSS
ncbi:MAG: hypothetical protein P8Y45_07825 [Exilibacterium sp.]